MIILGAGAMLAPTSIDLDAFDAVVWKTATLQPIQHPARVWQNAHAVYNDVGLANSGLVEELDKAATALAGRGPWYASVALQSPSEARDVAKLVSNSQTAEGIELNTSCPNHTGYRLTPRQITQALTDLRGAYGGKIWAKVSDDVGYHAAVEGGADAVVLGNALRGRGVSVSGPFLFDLTLAWVDALAGEGTPVIASGGVLCRKDVEMLLEHGATGVQVCSGVYLSPAEWTVQEGAP